VDINIDKNKVYGFMAGCSLSSYSPNGVADTAAYLNSVFKKFAVIQKCCGKPTKLLGKEELFIKRNKMLQDDIDGLNIDEMIVGCQNCKSVLDKQSPTPIHSLWEIFPLIGLPDELRGKAKKSDIVFTIHDSCSTRYESKLQDGIRWILDELGYKYIESKYSKDNTLCCGSGGMVGAVNPELTERVIKRRVETLESKNVVVYCASCNTFIRNGGVKTWHILDLLWGPVVYEGDACPSNALSSPLEAWVNRYKAKIELQKAVK